MHKRVLGVLVTTVIFIVNVEGHTIRKYSDIYRQRGRTHFSLVQ